MLRKLFVQLSVVMVSGLIIAQSLPSTTNTPEQLDAVVFEQEIKTDKELFLEKWNKLNWEEKVAWNPNKCNLQTEILWDLDGRCAPKPVQAPVASVPSGGGDCHQEVLKYDWNHAVAVAVMLAESGGRSDARGDTSLTYYQNGVLYGDSWGCFQIRHLPGRPSPDKLVNAQFNVQYAYNMYKASDWGPWSVCHYKVNCY